MPQLPPWLVAALIVVATIVFWFWRRVDRDRLLDRVARTMDAVRSRKSVSITGFKYGSVVTVTILNGVNDDPDYVAVDCDLGEVPLAVTVQERASQCVIEGAPADVIHAIFDSSMRERFVRLGVGRLSQLDEHTLRICSSSLPDQRWIADAVSFMGTIGAGARGAGRSKQHDREVADLRAAEHKRMLVAKILTIAGIAVLVAVLLLTGVLG